MKNENHFIQEYLRFRQKMVTQLGIATPDYLLLTYFCGHCQQNSSHFFLLSTKSYENLTAIINRMSLIKNENNNKTCSHCNNDNATLMQLIFSSFYYALDQDFWIKFLIENRKFKAYSLGLMRLSGQLIHFENALSAEYSTQLFQGVDLLFRQGIEARLLGNFDDAIHYFTEIISSDPDCPQVYKELSNIYIRLKRRPLAKSMIKKYLTLNIEDAEGHYLLGFLYGGERLYSHATIELQKSIELNPKHDESYFYLGKIYHEQEKNDKAKEQWIKVLEINPDHSLAKIGLADLELETHESD